ncbi:DUF2852 domain-containing protein [Rhodopila sp.]|uniref:DUF2852 domain-containing protein n=1 Tax=Rhodopila sp. TaxID=2480087 RepID=UPI003D11947A
MTSAANPDAYGPRGWNQGPWGNTKGPQWQQPNHGAAYTGQNGGPQNSGPGWDNPAWGGPPFWHPAGLSRPAAIAFTILGFLFWWPVGLALLIYTIGSGRMGCFGRRRRAMSQHNGQDAGPWANWKTWGCGPSGRAASTSGNRAFDEYKAETLRRMEEEQKEFGSFLERLRFAKDKAEFDQFMAERRARPPAPPTEEQPAT